MRRTIFLTTLGVLAAACSTASRPDRTASADPTRSPVPTSAPFEVKGTVQDVGGGGLLGMETDSLTIAREGAPAARLHVAKKTRVTLDDRPSKLSDLREGDEVRASFDFDGDRPVAIEIVAEPRRR